MRGRFGAAFLCALFVSAFALADVEFARRIYGQPGLHRFGKVSDEIYRGAKPEPHGYQTLRRLGIRTVINLERSTRRRDVERAGLKYYHIPLNPARPPSETEQRRIFQIMTDTTKQPVFVHCYHGRDRTGVIVALYRIKFQGWNRRDAIKEMISFGHDPPGYPALTRYLREGEIKIMRKAGRLEN